MKAKLVRDKIPAIIVAADQMPDFYVAQREEYEARLMDKMVEELEEFRENPCLEEAADMFEVFLAICDHWAFSHSAVTQAADQKREDRGGFQQRFVLKLKQEFNLTDDDTTEDWNTSPYGEQK